MSQKNTMGKLLSTFRFKKQQARQKAEEVIWERNKMVNKARRDGHEIHESAVTDREGNTVIALELWKKVDEEVVKISVDVKTDSVSVESDIKELMK